MLLSNEFENWIWTEFTTMILERIKSDGSAVEYKVVFDTNEIEKKIDEAVAERRKTFKVAGYRVGHAPNHIVRNSVEGSVVKDVLRSLISEAGGKVVSESEIPSLAAGPVYRFVGGGYEKGKSVEVIFTLEAVPEFELVPVELKIKKIVPEITDEEVAEEKERLMKESPVYEDAGDGHKIQEGDSVSYKAICYNNGIESKRRSVESSITVRADGVDPSAFSSGFVGKQKGESFEFVPQNSKNLKYRVIIESVRSPRQLGPEEFAERSRFKNVQELDEAIRSRLRGEAEALAFSVHKNQVLEAISKCYDFDVPERIYRHELRNVITEIRRGYHEEEVENKSDEELEKECAEVAKTRVILGYVLSKMANVFDIRVSDDDLRIAIYFEIQRDLANADRILNYYSNNEQALEYRKAEVLEAKVIAHLMSKAEIEEVKMSGKETKKFVDEFFDDQTEDEDEVADGEKDVV